MVLFLGSLPAYAVNVEIEGPTTVCPRTEVEFTAKAYTQGVERNCNFYWGVYKNGVLLEEGGGSTFLYKFEDIGNYQIIAYTTWCQYGGSGNASITVNSRVKMPSPITGPAMCNDGQTYSFISNPPLSYPVDSACHPYHYEYLWTAPSGWSIDGGGNTLFTHANQINLTAPVGTPSGYYPISVESSIPSDGSIPWFSTPRTYNVQVGSPASINGLSHNQIVCDNQYINLTSEYNYQSYNWTVLGGTVVSGQGTAEVTILTDNNPFQGYNNLSVSLNVTSTCMNGNGYSETIAYVQNCGGGPIDPSMYPNPASEELHIEMAPSVEQNTEGQANSPYEVKLYDSSGNELYSQITSGSKLTLDVRQLKNGFYYVHILYKDGILTRKKIRVER
jgi:hypothetical protein